MLLLEKQISVNGETYFVRDSGGDGAAVLLLHGWPDDGTVWRHQIDHLSRVGYRVICPDWLCHGKSSVPKNVSRCNRFQLARDTVSLLDALNIRRAHLIAHDYGATVSWETARLYPDRFYSFVALSVGHSYQILKEILTGHALNYTWLILHGLTWSHRFYLSDNAKPFKKKFVHHPDADRILEKLTGDGDKTFFTVWERANSAVSVAAEFVVSLFQKKPVIPLPTLAIYSENDVWMTPGQLEKSAQYVSGDWNYVSLKNCDHWLQLERPDDVNTLLSDWLSKFHTSP
jgi:epoxide hydrolase 4